jgi:hypothetical protein
MEGLCQLKNPITSTGIEPANYATASQSVKLTSQPFVSQFAENVEASTSDNPMGLHGLLQGQLYFYTHLQLLTKSRKRGSIYPLTHKSSRLGA